MPPPISHQARLLRRAPLLPRAPHLPRAPPSATESESRPLPVGSLRSGRPSAPATEPRGHRSGCGRDVGGHHVRPSSWSPYPLPNQASTAVTTELPKILACGRRPSSSAVSVVARDLGQRCSASAAPTPETDDPDARTTARDPSPTVLP